MPDSPALDIEALRSPTGTAYYTPVGSARDPGSPQPNFQFWTPLSSPTGTHRSMENSSEGGSTPEAPLYPSLGSLVQSLGFGKNSTNQPADNPPSGDITRLDAPFDDHKMPTKHNLRSSDTHKASSSPETPRRGQDKKAPSPIHNLRSHTPTTTPTVPPHPSSDTSTRLSTRKFRTSPAQSPPVNLRRKVIDKDRQQPTTSEDDVVLKHTPSPSRTTRSGSARLSPSLAEPKPQTPQRWYTPMANFRQPLPAPSSPDYASARQTAVNKLSHLLVTYHRAAEGQSLQQLYAQSFKDPSCNELLDTLLRSGLDQGHDETLGKDESVERLTVTQKRDWEQYLAGARSSAEGSEANGTHGLVGVVVPTGGEISDVPANDTKTTQEDAVGDDLVQASAIENEMVQEDAVSANIVQVPIVDMGMVQEDAVSDDVVQAPAVGSEVVQKDAVSDNTVQEPVIDIEMVQEDAFSDDVVQAPAVESEMVQKDAVSDNTVQVPVIDIEMVQEDAVSDDVVQASAVESEVVQKDAVSDNTVQESVIDIEMVQEDAVSDDNTVQAPVADLKMVQGDTFEDNMIQAPDTDSEGVKVPSTVDDMEVEEPEGRPSQSPEQERLPGFERPIEPRALPDIEADAIDPIVEVEVTPLTRDADSYPKASTARPPASNGESNIKDTTTDGLSSKERKLQRKLSRRLHQARLRQLKADEGLLARKQVGLNKIIARIKAAGDHAQKLLTAEETLREVKPHANEARTRQGGANHVSKASLEVKPEADEARARQDGAHRVSKSARRREHRRARKSEDEDSPMRTEGEVPAPDHPSAHADTGASEEHSKIPAQKSERHQARLQAKKAKQKEDRQSKADIKTQLNGARVPAVSAQPQQRSKTTDAKPHSRKHLNGSVRRKRKRLMEKQRRQEESEKQKSVQANVVSTHDTDGGVLLNGNANADIILGEDQSTDIGR